MTTFRVSTADVAEFAAASGDVNPLHVDVAYATKTNFGGPVVHGALVVLHTLGALPEGRLEPAIRRITARFHGAVVPGRDYDVVDGPGAETPLRLRVEDHGHRLADVTVETDPGRWARRHRSRGSDAPRPRSGGWRS
ncbi:MaoC/PaaZ C-terminal domain-containing protein [Amycolatopsis sp. NPDC051061]|uniref:MaoC/PaaZ C-terminal domain-containing protein n=1 Tax=Amycolatopsis sp. NPDC051061 TaxID=3155042 RepID=UPI00343F941D